MWNVLKKPQVIIHLTGHIQILTKLTKLMPNLHWPPSEKWSGEQRQISWAYPQIVVRT